MTKLKDIRLKVMEKLNTLKWVWKPFDFIYNYHTLEGEGFPYVSFEPFQLNQDIQDTQNNKRSYLFDVFIYQEMNNRTREEALNILIDCFEEVIDLFDTDFTLWWSVIQVIPVFWEFAAVEHWKWKIMFSNLQLNIEVLKNITN